MNSKLRKTLLAILVILAITFSAVMATSCQNNSDDLKTTETLAETRQIPDYGMAMVTIGNTEKLVSGKITTDVNGRSIITDEVTGETYDVIAAQMIEEGNLCHGNRQGYQRPNHYCDWACFIDIRRWHDRDSGSGYRYPVRRQDQRSETINSQTNDCFREDRPSHIRNNCNIRRFHVHAKST